MRIILLTLLLIGAACLLISLVTRLWFTTTIGCRTTNYGLSSVERCSEGCNDCIDPWLGCDHCFTFEYSRATRDAFYTWAGVVKTSGVCVLAVALLLFGSVIMRQKTSMQFLGGLSRLAACSTMVATHRVYAARAAWVEGWWHGDPSVGISLVLCVTGALCIIVGAAHAVMKASAIAAADNGVLQGVPEVPCPQCGDAMQWHATSGKYLCSPCEIHV